MLFAQIEPGHACPISMTYAAVPALRAQPDLAEAWLPRLYSPRLRRRELSRRASPAP